MRRLFLAAFAAALVFTLVMAWLPHPPPVPLKEDDKFWHVVAFVALSVLASAAFPAVPAVRIGERLSFLGALIEVVQSIPALHRDCDIRDWIADTLAIAATLAIVAGFRRMRGETAPAEAQPPRGVGGVHRTAKLGAAPGATPPNSPHQGEGFDGLGPNGGE